MRRAKALFLSDLDEGLNALDLNLEALKRRHPGDEEHMLWSMSTGLDTVYHYMFSEVDPERRVRKATGDARFGSRNRLRLEVVRRIYICLGITDEEYKKTSHENVSVIDFMRHPNNKRSLLADIYGRLIVPYIVGSNQGVLQGVLHQVSKAVGGRRRQLALEIVSLSGHTLFGFLNSRTTMSSFWRRAKPPVRRRLVP
jgi:hypothetical protein